jgi:hypothetical protein
LSELDDAINRSRFLRHRVDDDKIEPLVYLRKEEQDLFLATNSGAEVAFNLGNDSATATSAAKNIVGVAEQFARSQHLLGLHCTNPKEKLSHSIEITVGTVSTGKQDKVFQQDGEDQVAEYDRTFISLRNAGKTTVYISVFDINAVGKITLISEGSPKGVQLPPGREYVLGEDEFGFGLSGMLMSWPGNVSKVRSVDEHLMFILTDAPVDLQHLAEPRNPERRDWDTLTNLERLTAKIAFGRDMQREAAGARICFDTTHIPFSLQCLDYGEPEPLAPHMTTENMRVLAAKDLPPPESIPEIDSAGNFSAAEREREERVSINEFQNNF